MKQLLAFELVEAPPCADHHSRQAALGVELMPQQAVSVGRERPQPLSTFRIVDREHFRRQVCPRARLELPPV
jgi:hypothetical protein